jgi:glucokinase
MKRTRVLAGDVGGTKTLLAILTRTPAGWIVGRKTRFSSKEALDLTSPAREFLRDEDPIPEIGCLGVAGPVTGRVVETTNIPWVIDADRLQEDLGIPRIRLVNDFAAVAVGTQFLRPEDLVILNEGVQTPRGARVVLGAGTGLGVGILVWQGDRYLAIPTEGGHASFAPTDDLQVDLLRHLQKDLGRVSVERLLSGSGLVRIYDFLEARGEGEGSTGIREEMATGDPAAAISRGALERSDRLCRQALRVFVSMLGTEAGDLALQTLARGGVYIAGGIAPRILPALQDGTFMSAFLDKGRFRHVVESMPVRVVVNPDTPLIGAASLA